MGLLESELRHKLQGVKVLQARTEPLWAGPESDGEQGGVTQSMLSSYLVCPERFRLKVVEGWRSSEGFNHRIEYGSMWHVCEEKLAASPHYANDVGGDFWLPLQEHCKELCRHYPLQRVEIDKWYNICRMQFPEYVKFWAAHPDVTERTPLLQEQVFNVSHRLPSGRTVHLRGKWDSVDLVGKGKSAGIWLQENKTKGDIREQQMQRQLTCDLQTMMYMVALETLQKAIKGGQVIEPYLI